MWQHGLVVRVEDVGDGAEVENREVTGGVSMARPGRNVIGKGDLISWLPV